MKKAWSWLHTFWVTNEELLLKKHVPVHYWNINKKEKKTFTTQKIAQLLAKKLWNITQGYMQNRLLKMVLVFSLTLSLWRTPTSILLDYFSFSHFSTPFLEKKTNFNKFCTKFCMKEAKFLPYKCTSLTIIARLPAFFQNFLKTLCALRVNETKLTSRNAFIFNLFALEHEND